MCAQEDLGRFLHSANRRRRGKRDRGTVIDTAIKENTQQETAVQEGSFEVEETVQELVEGEPATEAKLENAETSAAELAITAELLLHPFNTPVQALWLCEMLKKELGAEVLYMEGSPDGTVIKVTVREPVPLADFLAGMAEVAEAWEEPMTQKSRGNDPLLGIVPPSSNEQDKVVCVALKPADLTMVENFSDTLKLEPQVVAAAAVAD